MAFLKSNKACKSLQLLLQKARPSKLEVTTHDVHHKQQMNLRSMMQTGETGQQLKWMAVVSLGVIRLRTYAIPKQGKRRKNNENSHIRIYAKEVTHSKIVGLPQGRGEQNLHAQNRNIFCFCLLCVPKALALEWCCAFLYIYQEQKQFLLKVN